MYCSECGAQNDDRETRCFRCNARLRQPPAPPPVQPQPPPAPPPQSFYPPPGAMSPYQPYPPPAPPLPGYLPTYTGLAIVSLILASASLLLCCMPVGILFGILAWVNASQVNNKLGMGDHYGAAQASKNACLFGWIGTIISGAILLLGIGWIVFSRLLVSNP